MASALTDSLLTNMSSIIPVSYQNVNADDGEFNKQCRGGTYGFMIDSFGAHILLYCQNRSGSAFGYGELMSRVGDANAKTAISNIDSGTTTSATKTSGFTAKKH